MSSSSSGPLLLALTKVLLGVETLQMNSGNFLLSILLFQLIFLHLFQEKNFLLKVLNMLNTHINLGIKGFLQVYSESEE